MSSVNGYLNFIQRFLSCINIQQIDFSNRQELPGSTESLFIGKWYPEFISRILKECYYNTEKNLSKRLNKTCTWKGLQETSITYSVGLKSCRTSLETKNNLTGESASFDETSGINSCQHLIKKMLEQSQTIAAASSSYRGQNERVIQFLLDHRKLSDFHLCLPKVNLNLAAKKNCKRVTIENNEVDLLRCSRHSRHSRRSRTKHSSFNKDKSSGLCNRKDNTQTCSIDGDIVVKKYYSHSHANITHGSQSRSVSSPVLKTATRTDSLPEVRKLKVVKISKKQLSKDFKHTLDEQKIFNNSQIINTDNNSSNLLLFDQDDAIKNNVMDEEESLHQKKKVEQHPADSIDSGVEISKPSRQDFCSDNSEVDSTEEVDRAVKKITDDLIQWEKRARARAKLKGINLDRFTSLIKVPRVNICPWIEDDSQWSSESEEEFFSTEASPFKLRI